jgi:hypothetical protein
MIKAIADGAVELYHNNVKKLETTSTGVAITGNLSLSSNILQFDQSGTRSWNIQAASGKLKFFSGDGAGNYDFDHHIVTTGGLQISGSIDPGATDYGYYQSAGNNIILKGDSSGRSGIFFESEKDGTNINDPSDYGFIQFHSYGYGNTTGEANNLVIGVSNDSTDKVILQAPYNGGVMIGYKDATSGTGLTLSEVIHSNATSYNNGNWDTAYTHAGSTHAPTNAEQNVQSDWDATSGDALILNKPTIPAAITDFVSKANVGLFEDVITIKEDTDSSMTAAKSLLTLHNQNSDISQQRSYIDFKFTDTNAKIGRASGRERVSTRV